VLSSACKSPYTDPTYKHQTKRITTPYTDWKKNRESAEKSAKKELDFYAKDECRRMSYGWYLKKIEDYGKLNCEETGEGFHCKHTEVSLLCEQLDERSRN
jgi:hypothetical protein